jgi:hypothetical protein
MRQYECCAKRPPRRAETPVASPWKAESPGVGNQEEFVDDVRRWAAAGASHVSTNTMGAGLSSVDDHLAAQATAAGAVETLAG